ncbi:unnamed protein product [Boreogadus saida]
MKDGRTSLLLESPCSLSPSGSLHVRHREAALSGPLPHNRPSLLLLPPALSGPLPHNRPSLLLLPPALSGPLPHNRPSLLLLPPSGPLPHTRPSLLLLPLSGPLFCLTHRREGG